MPIKLPIPNRRTDRQTESLRTDQEGRGCAVLRDVVVRDLHRQGDVLRAVGAAGADLGREALDAARRGEASLQHGLLEDRIDWNRYYEIIAWVCVCVCRGNQSIQVLAAAGWRSNDCLWVCTSKLPRSDLLMEDDGQLERVERPLSACLPLRSCRLNIATQTHTHRRTNTVVGYWRGLKLHVLRVFQTGHKGPSNLKLNSTSADSLRLSAPWQLYSELETPAAMLLSMCGPNTTSRIIFLGSPKVENKAETQQQDFHLSFWHFDKGKKKKAKSFEIKVNSSWA